MSQTYFISNSLFSAFINVSDIKYNFLLIERLMWGGDDIMDISLAEGVSPIVC